ncbi:MAG: helix-turn-helix domain-containing protein [Lachnospiraceae bacterium]|nr:helix-turn-helix domain-containing protein [Lachnospiraceae bacterium]
MTFRKKNKNKDLSNALPLTIGSRIRMFRELRDLSQRELGEKCGFPPLTAAARIGQYEADKKDPREDILAVMSEALNIDENALYNRANLTLPKMFHILFDLEELYGLHPVDNLGCVLAFDVKDNEITPEYEEIFKFFLEWIAMYKKCLPEEGDSESVIKMKKNTYKIWKGEYPSKVFRLNEEELEQEEKKRQKMRDLENTMLELYSEEEQEKLNSIVEDAKKSIDISKIKIERESDLILMIQKLIENGLKIENSECRPYPRTVDDDICSVKTEDVFSSANNKMLFSELDLAFDQVNKVWDVIERRITVKGKEMYVTYTCKHEKAFYFRGVQQHWNYMMEIIRTRRDIDKSDTMRAITQSKFLSIITGAEDWPFKF